MNNNFFAFAIIAAIFIGRTKEFLWDWVPRCFYAPLAYYLVILFSKRKAVIIYEKK